MTTNIDRAAETIRRVDGDHTLGAGALAEALADEGLLRPGPSSRYDGEYQASFSRDEYAEDGPHIEASVATHYPAPERKVVHRADVHIDIGGEHGYHILSVYATAEWCREAASILLDVADEVDRNNKETQNVEH